MNKKQSADISVGTRIFHTLVLPSSSARNVLFNVAERFSPGAPLHVALTLPSDSPQVTLVRASLMALANDTSEIVAAEASIEPGERCGGLE